MTTARSYGSWHRVAGHSGYALTLEGQVADALLAGADYSDYSDEDIHRVANAYRDAINEALPEGYSLCGDEFFGPVTDDEIDLEALVDGIDFWAIVEALGPE